MDLDRILYKIIKTPRELAKTPDKPRSRGNIKGKLIKKKFRYMKDSDKLFVMLPGWGGPLKYNAVLRKVISKKGYSFLEYEFPRGILSSDWEKTLECFDIIREEVIKEIKELKKEHKFSTVYLAGVSLGSFHACRIANNNKDITEMCLVIPGNCLAETVWGGMLTQNIKQDYKAQGISLRQLKRYWRELAPENNIDNLKVKHITIAISKADQVVPFHCGNKLLKSLKKHKYPAYYDINKSLGHLLTGVKFYSNPGKILFRE